LPDIRPALNVSSKHSAQTAARIDHIDEDTRGLVLEVCGQELADAAIVNVGEANTQGGFFTRVLHLIEDPLGQGLAPCAAASMPEPTAKQKAPTI